MTPTLYEQIRDALAIVTVAMPVILVALHAARRVVSRLRVHALTTADTRDEKALDRVLALLDWIDAVVDAVSSVLPRPPAARPELNRTPGLERYERQIANPDAEP